MSNIERRTLLSTTNKGNSWSVSSSYELLVPDPLQLMKKFVDGNNPVVMGSLITGKFKSSFPDGILKLMPAKGSHRRKQKRGETEKITGLTEATEECVVAIFTDVDFISDLVAYQDTFFGKIVIGDNSTLLLNTIDDLRGSSELISIRSRGSYKRPFIVVDAIEKKAERETSAEEDKINAEIAGFQDELNSIISSAKEGEEEIIGSSILQKKKDIELKIHKAQRELRRVKMKRREQIESLGNVLRNLNMLMTPGIILIIAIVLGIRRSVRKRHYISHASDS